MRGYESQEDRPRETKDHQQGDEKLTLATETQRLREAEAECTTEVIGAFR